MEFYAKIVFVNASTLGSTFILLKLIRGTSKGMGNASGQLGHNLMDHHFRCGAEGSAEGFEDKYTTVEEPMEFIFQRYQNVGNDKRDYLRGFGYLVPQEVYGIKKCELAFGENFKDTMSLPADLGAWD
jgi:hypothetical protein